jgi:hypothetical protein
MPIRSEDLNKEIQVLEDTCKQGSVEAVQKGILKGLCLIAKLLRDVRGNQTKPRQKPLRHSSPKEIGDKTKVKFSYSENLKNVVIGEDIKIEQEGDK